MTFVLTWIDLNWYIWYLQFVNLSVSHLSIIQSVGKFNYDTATTDYNSAFIWNSKWMICSLMKFLVCSCCTNYCFFLCFVVVVVVVVFFTWLFLLIKGFINLSCIFIVNVLLFCCSMVYLYFFLSHKDVLPEIKQIVLNMLPMNGNFLFIHLNGWSKTASISGKKSSKWQAHSL